MFGYLTVELDHQRRVSTSLFSQTNDLSAKSSSQSKHLGWQKGKVVQLLSAVYHKVCPRPHVWNNRAPHSKWSTDLL